MDSKKENKIKGKEKKPVKSTAMTRFSWSPPFK